MFRLWKRVALVLTVPALLVAIVLVILGIIAGEWRAVSAITALSAIAIFEVTRHLRKNG